MPLHNASRIRRICASNHDQIRRLMSSSPGGSVTSAGHNGSGASAPSSSSTDRLRADVLACLLAGIRSVDPRSLVSDFLKDREELAGSVSLVGIGKAAGDMAAGAVAVLGSRVSGGILVAPEGVAIDAIEGVEVYRGGHPIPNDRGVAGAHAIYDLASAAEAGETLICLISGGGSALMTLPPEGITLEEVQQTTDLLLRAGATIQELNAVRKHLDRLKGGRLARKAVPARVIALVLSDVIGDPLDVIASGPLSPDPSTFAQAVDVLKTRSVWEKLPSAVRVHLEKGVAGDVEESPKPGDPAFETVEVHLVGNNSIAAAAVRKEAESRGYATRLLTTSLSGESTEVGRVLGAMGREMRRSGEPVGVPGCLVAAGETTVTVRGEGRGGRNQELALSAAFEIAGDAGIVIGSVGTDGIDGPTDAAGAIVDGTTLDRANAMNLDAKEALARNDSYPVLTALGDIVLTGPTGTNVMDLQIVLVGDPEAG